MPFPLRIVLPCLLTWSPALGRAQTTTLPPVTVASRVGAEGSRATQVITRAMLDQLPGASVQAALAWALGGDLQLRSPAQAELALRGGSYEQTLILVDGQRMRDLQTGHFALDLAVPWESIERIEIVRGPAAAQFGADAVGGAVNIVTRATGKAVRLRAGSRGLVDAALSAGTRLNGSTTAGVHVDRLRTDGHRPGTDADITQLRASVEQRSGRQRWRTDLGFGSRDFGAATFYAPYNSYERTRTLTAGSQLELFPSARQSVTVRAGLRSHTDDFILIRTDPARYRNQHRSTQGELEASTRLALGGGTVLAAGAEALFAQLRSARLGNRQQLRAAVFTELQQPIGTRVQGNIGARLDGGTGVGTRLVPSAGVTVVLRRDLTGRVNYAAGWRQPTWTDRYYVDPANRGTPTLQPELFQSGDLGLLWAPASGYRVDGAMFTRTGRNTLDWVRRIATAGVAAEPWVATNVGTVRTVGTELLASTPALAGVTWTARGTLLDVRADVVPGVEGKYALRPVTQAFGVTARMGREDHAWLLLDVTQARRRGETGYVTAAARAGVRVRTATVTLDLTNLGRARALDASGVPIAGPAVAVGVLWRGRP